MYLILRLNWQQPIIPRIAWLFVLPENTQRQEQRSGEATMLGKQDHFPPGSEPFGTSLANSIFYVNHSPSQGITQACESQGNFRNQVCDQGWSDGSVFRNLCWPFGLRAAWLLPQDSGVGNKWIYVHWDRLFYLVSSRPARATKKTGILSLATMLITRNCPYLQFQRIWHPFWPLQAPIHIGA